LNRSESTKSTSLSDSGRRFLNNIKSRLKFGASSSSDKSQSINNQQNGTSNATGLDEEEDHKRPISSAQVEEISRTFKVMPVAVEPLANNKSAVITCMLKLPQGGQNATPKGSSPFLLCSAYVQVSSSSSLVNYYNYYKENEQPSNNNETTASTANSYPSV